MSGIIEGLLIGGTSITVANEDRAIVVSVSTRVSERPIVVALTEGDSKRLRRLLSAAERRASE